MRRAAKHLFAVAALTLLGACGNDTNVSQPIQILSQSLRASIGGKQEPVAAIGDAQLAVALNATTEPVLLVDLESRKSQALMLRIERNGAYDTFATSARQTVITRNGLITGTRGLGGDLMSSEVDALLSLVTSGRAGQAPYVMRFLTGDDLTKVERYSCDVAPAGSKRVTRGAVDTTGREMIANCTDDKATFTASFVVDKSGHILQSRQWLGDFLGYVGSQAIRK